MKDQLDVTCYYILLLMCSTCFGHQYNPSSRACDCVVELPHRSFCSQFVVCWKFGAAGFEWCPCWRLKLHPFILQPCFEYCILFFLFRRPMKTEDSVLKRRHIKFRPRGITPKHRISCPKFCYVNGLKETPLSLHD